MQPKNNPTKHYIFDLTRAQTFPKSFYAKSEVKTSTYSKKTKKLASLTLLRYQNATDSQLKSIATPRTIVVSCKVKTRTKTRVQS